MTYFNSEDSLSDLVNDVESMYLVKEETLQAWFEAASYESFDVKEFILLLKTNRDNWYGN